MQYKGKKTLIDPETGEELEMDMTESGKRNNFFITYITTIIKMIESIGNKKMDVVKYILKNMDIGSNTLVQTQEEIANGAEVSRPVVWKTLKLLEEANIIRKKTGAVMLNPKLAHKGNEAKERYLLTKFYKLDEKTQTEE